MYAKPVKKLGDILIIKMVSCPLTVMSVMSRSVVVVGDVLVLVEEDAHDLRLLLLLDGAVDVQLLHNAIHNLGHVGCLQVQDKYA